MYKPCPSALAWTACDAECSSCSLLPMNASQCAVCKLELCTCFSFSLCVSACIRQATCCVNLVGP